MAGGKSITPENIFKILFCCLLPIILVVMWTVSFIKKTQSDECNKLNYECDPPQINVVLGNLPPKQPFNDITNPSTLDPDQQKAINAARIAQNGTTTNPSTTTKSTTTTIPTTTTKSSTTTKAEIKQIDQCVGKPRRIKRATPDSQYTIDTLKGSSIAIFCISCLLALFNGPNRLFEDTTLAGGSKPLIFSWAHNADNLVINIIVSWVILLGGTGFFIYAYAFKQNKHNTYLAFNISLIALFALLGLSDILSPQGDELFPKYITYIFFAIFLALIAGTIYMFKFQEDNIKEGKISHAINEAIIAMTPPMMAIMVLISIALIIENLFGKSGSMVFGITQIISVLILIACIAMYYDYSKKCRESVPRCELDVKTKYYDVQTGLTGKRCIPYTGMNITTKTITNMGIAVSVLIGLNNIVGAIAFGIANPK